MGKHDLKKYKESLMHLDHLQVILHILALSIRGLAIYKDYIPVMKILLVMEDQKQILEAHYKKFKRTKETKGEVL